MANRPDLDDDDDFSDIYKAYTGPLGTSATNMQEKPLSNIIINNNDHNKRSPVSSDEEEERDPNAVPTDFTSREAKVWEAKSKATERNWKKRKEEEMICKICGESGHFTQGCPSTLGGKRNSQDFFERVAARDKHVRALFTDKVIERIEKDNGCKIRMDEKFIIVSGKDRLVLRKGVDAVHKVIKDEGNDRGSPGSLAGKSRSSDCSPVGGNHRFSRSESERPNLSPRNTSQFPRFTRQRSLEDRIRGDLQKPSRNSPQAYGSDGGRGRSSHSRSPARVSYSGNSYSAYEPHRQGTGAYRSDVWDTERRGSDMHADIKFEQSPFPQTIEDLEMEYQREVMDLARIRDQQVHDENYKHDEICKELRQNYMKRIAALRDSHAKQWEDFLRMDAQRQQQQAQLQQMHVTGFSGYQQSSFTDRDSLGGQPYLGSFNREPSGQFASPSETYPHSRPRDTYNDFQRQRPEGYGRSYDRY
ncbi:hypothetical protein KSS87_003182 [Heliosperma pusillum]|nr:hypothetical protein KSS87_003182 [Heliosperma pusillum]